MLLVCEHHEELELDLLDPAMGPTADLIDFWRGTLTPRRLELLIRDLPDHSRFKAAVDPERAVTAAWKPHEYILAELWDLLLAVNWPAKAGQRPTFPRPAEQLRHAQIQQAMRDALAAQAQRNRERDRRQSG